MSVDWAGSLKSGEMGGSGRKDALFPGGGGVQQKAQNREISKERKKVVWPSCQKQMTKDAEGTGKGKDG